MADIDLKTETPDTTLPTTGFLFGADSQAAASPSVFTVQSVATTLLGSTTLTGATITTSSPVIDAAQTWNAGGVTFTGLKFNATDTASAAGSLLMDLQVGGASFFSVRKNGRLTLTGTGNYFDPASGGISLFTNNARTWHAGFGSFGVPQLGLGSDATSPNVFLGPRAAANLRFGAADAAAPVAQTLSVQSVVAGTTNTAGANLTITGSQGTGNAAGGSIIFQVAPAGSTGTAQNALATRLTIGPSAVTIHSAVLQNQNGSQIATATTSGGAAAFSFSDGVRLSFGTTTGTKIGAATTQKIAFWDATPVVQPTAVADATDAATVITQLNALLAHMRTIGLIAT